MDKAGVDARVYDRAASVLSAEPLRPRRPGLRPTRHPRAAKADRRSLTSRHRLPAPRRPDVTHPHQRGGPCRDCSMRCIPAIHRIRRASRSPGRCRSCQQGWERGHSCWTRS